MREEEGCGSDLRYSSEDGIGGLGEDGLGVGGCALRDEYGSCSVWFSLDGDRDRMVHGVNVKFLGRCAVVLTSLEGAAVFECAVLAIGNPSGSSVGEDTSAKTSEEWLVALSSRWEKPCCS